MTQKITHVDNYYISLICKFTNFSTNLVQVSTSLVYPYHYNQTWGFNTEKLTAAPYVGKIIVAFGRY